MSPSAVISSSGSGGISALSSLSGPSSFSSSASSGSPSSSRGRSSCSDELPNPTIKQIDKSLDGNKKCLDESEKRFCGQEESWFAKFDNWLMSLLGIEKVELETSVAYCPAGSSGAPTAGSSGSSGASSGFSGPSSSGASTSSSGAPSGSSGAPTAGSSSSSGASSGFSGPSSSGASTSSSGAPSSSARPSSSSALPSSSGTAAGMISGIIATAQTMYINGQIVTIPAGSEIIYFTGSTTANVKFEKITPASELTLKISGVDVRFVANQAIEFHQNQKVKKAQLAEDTKIEVGIDSFKFKGQKNILFHPTGSVETATLAENAQFNAGGLSVKLAKHDTPIMFYDNGILELGFLAEDTRINAYGASLELKNGYGIGFYPNGKFKSAGALVNDVEIQNKRFNKGSSIEFTADGVVVGGAPIPATGVPARP